MIRDMAERAETPQLRAFSEGEGDRWFERNRQAMLEPASANDPSLRLIEAYGIKPLNVLEVGASNGYRLAALGQIHECKLTGLEPSAAAVADGLTRFSGLRLQVGVGSAIPFDEPFDLVIVNFVLHWVDRSLLLRTVAEIDRVTADGGFLVLGDFAPAHPARRHYHHLPGQGVFTYKQDYAAIFLASCSYQSIAMLSGHHASRATVADVDGDDERVATWLLRKRLDVLYADGIG